MPTKPRCGNEIEGKKCRRIVRASGILCESCQKLLKATLTQKEQNLTETLANPLITTKTEAVIKAGYSPKAAQTVPGLKMKNSAFAKLLESRRQEIQVDSGTTPADIVRILNRTIYGSIDDLLDKNGKFDIKKARRTGGIHQVESFEQTVRLGTGDNPDEILTTKVKVISRDKALDQLIKIMKISKTDFTANKIIAAAQHLAFQHGTSVAAELEIYLKATPELPNTLQAQILDYIAICPKEISVNPVLNTSADDEEE
jgi:hypothetical protein